MTSSTNKIAFVILFSVFKVSDAYDYRCLNCEDFNRQTVRECAHHIFECGNCLLGMIPDEKSSRFCYPLEVKGVEGESIELPCEFNSTGQCVWERDGQQVNIDNSERYRFKAKEVNEFISTENCTLLINNLSYIDEGQWQCGSSATSDNNSVKSAAISVNLIREVKTITTLPSNSQVPEPQKKDLSSATSSAVQPNTISLHSVKEEEKTTVAIEFRVPEQTKQISSSAIRIYLDNVMFDEHATFISNLRRTGSTLKCRTEHSVDELRWEIDGRVVNKDTSVKILELRHNDIDEHLNGTEWTMIRVYCHAVHGNHVDRFVTLANAEQEIELQGKKDEKRETELVVGVAMVVVLAVISGVLTAALLYWFFTKTKSQAKPKQTQDNNELREIKVTPPNNPYKQPQAAKGWNVNDIRSGKTTEGAEMPLLFALQTFGQ